MIYVKPSATLLQHTLDVMYVNVIFFTVICQFHTPFIAIAYNIFIYFAEYYSQMNVKIGCPIQFAMLLR